MSTSTSTSSASQLAALKDKLGRISAMRRLWLVTFRCMSEQATLPDGKLEQAGAAEEKINEYIDTIHKVTVFPRERLTPLRKICYEVYRELKDKGLLLGNSGAYIIPNKYTKEVQVFLDRKAREYREEIAKIAADYKSIYDEQVRLATLDIKDVTLRNVIIDLIPTKDEFVKRTYCSYAPYALALSDGMDEEDLKQIAQNVEEVHEEENRRFLGKIHEIFAAYLQRLEAEMAVNKTGRTGSLYAVCKRANEAFSRLDFALRGTSLYADLQAMHSYYKEGIVETIVVYMESIARGQDIPNFLAEDLKAKVEVLSSPEKFRDVCKLKNAPKPQPQTAPKNGEIESYSISSSQFEGKGTSAEPQYQAESFDITKAIKTIKDLQMPTGNPDAAANCAVESGSDPQVLTHADGGDPVAVIPCDPFAADEESVAVPYPADKTAAAPAAVVKEAAQPVLEPDVCPSVIAQQVNPAAAAPREQQSVRSSLASRFTLR